MHLLKNGHPAHVFTLEDRRKAARGHERDPAREARPLRAPAPHREMEQIFAKAEARRQRRAEKQRRRREQANALDWVERGYGARP
jgi:hypothetical protein